MNDSETSTDKDKSSKPDNSDHSDDGKNCLWCKTDKKPSNECFIGSQRVNKITENSQSVVEVVSAITSDHLIQLCTEQSNLYQTQNVQQQKASAKQLSGPKLHPKK
jgi:hypothetical protein